MGGCMGQWVGSGQMTNLIKLELINIIWFCLKIYNLSRHPYLWVDGWVNGWAHVKPLKSNKSWPNRDNSIMGILDILLDILLKPPQPFIGLFFTVFRTFWNFQHAFLQFSEHTEIFNMLFHSFQNMLKFSTHFQTWKLKTFTVKFYFYVVQIYVNQGSYKLSDWPLRWTGQ